MGSGGAHRRWTEEEKQKAAEMLRAGISHSKIAEAMGRSLDAIRGFWKHQPECIEKRQRGRQKRSEIARRVRRGESAKDLAEEYGMTKQAIYMIAKRDQSVETQRPYNKSEMLPPLGDMPNHPGCQCGYCANFCDARLRNGSIVGTCLALDREMNRSDFCIAKDVPEKGTQYPILFRDQVVWFDQYTDRGDEKGKWRRAE